MPPADLRLVPMTDREYVADRVHGEEVYAAEAARAGHLPLPDARRKAADSYARLLPQGLRTPGHRLWTAYDGDRPVGVLWLHLEEMSDGLHAFGYDMEVRAELRRQGYGRALLAAAEQVCRDLGVVSVGLNVFGSNVGARRLYEQVGFEVTAIQMRKRLSGS